MWNPFNLFNVLTPPSKSSSDWDFRKLFGSAISMRSRRWTKCLLSVSPWSASWEAWQRHQREERIWVRDGRSTESRADRIWQQVLTARGPWDDCNWQQACSKLSSCLHCEDQVDKEGKIKRPPAFPCCIWTRGIELQDVYGAEGVSRCVSGFGLDFH